MRHRRSVGARPRRAAAGTAMVLFGLALAACGDDAGSDQPPFGANDVPQTPDPSASASASATPLVYTGQQVSLSNSDNGTHIAAALGSDLLVRLTVPLADDCQGAHPCVTWHVDDSAGVLLRAQELTTCDKDTCTAQREAFLERTGTAVLSLVVVEPCSAFAGARCEPEQLSTLWSAHVTVGKST